MASPVINTKVQAGYPPIIVRLNAQIYGCSGEEALAAFYLKDEMPSLSDLHGGVKGGAVRSAMVNPDSEATGSAGPFGR